jgi:DNA helicase TIP49 (TBP-interacting protein)
MKTNVVKDHKTGKARNLKTGEIVNVEARKGVVFKIGQNSRNGAVTGEDNSTLPSGQVFSQSRSFSRNSGFRKVLLYDTMS